MSDLETIRAILRRAGVAFMEGPRVEMTEAGKRKLERATALPVGATRSALVAEAFGDDSEPTGGRHIMVMEGDGPRNVGYGGFFSRLFFDRDGALVEWGTYE